MAPRRSKLHIPRFRLAPKARSFRCSSSPTATRFAGLAVGGGRRPPPLRGTGAYGPFRRQGPLREKLVPNEVVDSCHASPVRDAVLSPPIPQKLSGPLGPPRFSSTSVFARRSRRLRTSCLLGTPGNAAPGQVVGRHLNRDLVAGQDADEVHPQLPGDVC